MEQLNETSDNQSRSQLDDILQFWSEWKATNILGNNEVNLV